MGRLGSVGDVWEGVWDVWEGVWELWVLGAFGSFGKAFGCFGSFGGLVMEGLLTGQGNLVAATAATAAAAAGPLPN